MYRHDSELHGSSSDEIYMVDLSSKVMVKLPVCRHLGGGGTSTCPRYLSGATSGLIKVSGHLSHLCGLKS